MIISATGMADYKDLEATRQEIYAIGIRELKLWKVAVKADKELFNQLFELIFSDDPRLAWRSCWIIDSASEDFPELLTGKLPDIINALIITRNSSLKRHFTRIIARYPIPEDFLSATVNRSFELLLPSEPIAVRVNAMQILFSITNQLPDLKGELISVIEHLMEEGDSAGFINRSEKLLRKLRF